MINRKLIKMIFELSKQQMTKLLKWKTALPPINLENVGAIGGVYTYSFIPTGVGNIVKVTRYDDYTIDLSDYENW